jgi:hypothetical protein
MKTYYYFTTRGPTFDEITKGFFSLEKDHRDHWIVELHNKRAYLLVEDRDVLGISMYGCDNMKDIVDAFNSLGFTLQQGD